MAMGGSSGKGVKNDINVTPLVDVVLVLLIIFMVITPMLQRGRDVHLPKAKSVGEEKQKSDPLIVSVTTDKKLWIEANAVDEGAFEADLSAEFVKEPNRRVLLKGDEQLTVGDVRKVMDHAKKAGAKAVELAVEEIKEK
jgi:biopolymer transport protein TolR